MVETTAERKALKRAARMAGNSAEQRVAQTADSMVAPTAVLLAVYSAGKTAE